MNKFESRLVRLDSDQVDAILPLITVKVNQVFVDPKDKFEGFSFWRYSTLSSGEKFWYPIEYKKGLSKYDLSNAILSINP